LKHSISLEKNQIRLRAPEPEDTDLLYSWENDPSIWRLSNTLLPFSRHDIEQFILNSRTDIVSRKQARWMIDLRSGSEAETIGTIDLFDYDPMHRRAGLGILIKDEQKRNKGYAGTALEILIPYCFEVLALHQLYCNISDDNQASLALFKKHGFGISGTKKDWLLHDEKFSDEHFLQLIKK